MKRPQNAKYYLGGAVVLITFLVYLACLRNEFVNWDDSTYVFENQHIRSIDLAFFKWVFFDFFASNWHPLTWISHALDYALWGLNPLGHHLTNIILHAANAFVVVFLIIRLLDVVKERTAQSTLSLFLNERAILIAAGTTGLLFGLHPVHVESVAWVAERKDLLCALFFLLSILLYVKYAGVVNSKTENENIASRFFNKHYLLSLVFFILALLSKPMAVTLPVVLLILDWYPFQRVRSLGTFLNVFVEKLPFAAFSLASSIVTIMAQKAGGALATFDALPLSTRMTVAAKSLIDYLLRMIFPLNLNPIYPYPDAAGVSFFQPGYLSAVILLIGFTIASTALIRKQKLWLSVWGYYVITMVPVLGIVQVGSQATADRYTYLPSLGPFLLMGVMAAWIEREAGTLTKWRTTLRLFIGTVALFVIISMTYLTFAQISTWKNDIILWTHSIEKAPKVNIAYLNRAFAYKKRGQVEKAIDDYNTAIALNPYSFIAHYNLGNIFLNDGRIDNAIEEYQITITLKPDYAEAHNNLAAAFDDKGWTDQAIEQYERAIALKPDYAEGHYNLGQAYVEKGLIDKAVEQFRIAVDLNPENQDFRTDLADAYMKKKSGNILQH